MAATDDKDLAQTLIRAGALTPEQLKECQAAADDAHGKATYIEVAVRRGYVKEPQVEAARAEVERDQARQLALRRDAAVAKFALKRQFVKRERIEECRAEQLAREGQGQEVTLLEVLIEKGYVSDEQAEIVSAAVGEGGRRRLGDFEIIRKLGEGGMGAVYKARQVSMDRVVALKILPTGLAADEAFVKRFYREAQACAKLDHPNVIRGLAVGEAEGHHYFAMEFVDGRSLKDLVEREGPMPVWRALEVFKEVCRGLAHAHARDLIHRDIKPENILLTRDGVPKLADLGLAKETSGQRSAITESGTAMGTAYYMPPEQAKDAKRADKRSDIYALGATFYHLLTGRVPYEGDSSFAVMSLHETGVLVPPRKVNPDIPERLSLIIEKMMSKNPEFRFKTVDEVVQALEQVEVPRPKAPVAPARETPRPDVVAPAPKKPDTRAELWAVRQMGPGGQYVTRELDLPTLLRYVEEGSVSLDTQVRQGRLGSFMTMDHYRQFDRALRLAREKRQATQVRREPYRQIYDDYDRRLKHQARMRLIKRIAGWLVGLAVLGVGAWAAIKYLVPMIRNR